MLASTASHDDSEGFGGRSNDTKWRSKDFEHVSSLGRGQYGRVGMYRIKGTNDLVAIKVVKEDKPDLEQLEMELETHYQLSRKDPHPHIVQLYGYFHEQEQYWIVMEYVPGGNLHDKRQECENGCMEEAEVARHVLALASALLYCHKRGVMHRDVKLENVLLDANGCAKLADFGWCATTPGRRSTKCGTIDYQAPEQVQQRRYGAAVDIWSLGILTYELLFGEAPFFYEEASPYPTTTAAIQDQDVSFPNNVPVTPQARDFIVHMLKKDPEERLPLEQVRRHPWMLHWFDEPSELEQEP